MITNIICGYFIEEPIRRGFRKPFEAIQWDWLENDCHQCVSHRPDGSGYPSVCRNGKVIRIHRYIYEKYNGEIPDNMCVCHRCNNKLCINPKHLYLATKEENTHDAWKDGLNEVGEKSVHHRLTEKQVKEILRDKRTLVAIGEEYKVFFTTIADIKSGRTWKHIERPSK